MAKVMADMDFVAAGAFSFLLFLIYDINGATANLPALRPLFAVGLLLLGGTSAGIIYHSRGHAHMLSPVFFAIAIAFLALLMYSLFFALPPKNTYIDGKPKLCTSGMYALCRHPGVLWLILMYAAVFCALPSNLTLAGGVLFSVLDVIYAVFQDLWTFPRLFPEYGEYRRCVPFLLPTPKSIKTALFGNRGKQ